MALCAASTLWAASGSAQDADEGASEAPPDAPEAAEASGAQGADEGASEALPDAPDGAEASSAQGDGASEAPAGSNATAAPAAPSVASTVDAAALDPADAADEASADGEADEPPPPPPPTDARIGFEILGAVLGALSIGAAGFGIAMASSTVDHPDRSLDDMLLIGLLGVAVGLPIGASLGVVLTGNAIHTDADPAGPIVGALLGAGLGVLLGGAIAWSGQDTGLAAAIGGTTGGVLSLAGAIIGYELTLRPRSDGEATAWAPIIAPGPNGLVLGAASRF